MANMIKMRRRDLGLTQADLAAVAGVSLGLIGMWERGEILPPPGRIQKLAELLDVDEKALVGSVAALLDARRQRAIAKLAANSAIPC